MRAIVVYKEFSDHGRETEEWINELERRAERLDVETINPDTKEGGSFVQAYGIVDYPAVILEGEDGKVYFSSNGRPLPTFNEVLSYIFS